MVGRGDGRVRRLAAGLRARAACTISTSATKPWSTSAGSASTASRTRACASRCRECAKPATASRCSIPRSSTPEVEQQLRDLMTESRKGDVERGFSMTLGRAFDPDDRGLLLAVAFDAQRPAGRVLPVRARARDLGLVARPHAPLGARRPSERADRARRGRHDRAPAHKRATSGLALNFATFRAVLASEAGDRLVHRVEKWFLERMSDSMQIESLWTFNEKFQPEWHPRYACYDSPEHLLAASIAVARAESFWELPADRPVLRAARRGPRASTRPRQLPVRGDDPPPARRRRPRAARRRRARAPAKERPARLMLSSRHLLPVEEQRGRVGAAGLHRVPAASGAIVMANVPVTVKRPCCGSNVTTAPWVGSPTEGPRARPWPRAVRSSAIGSAAGAPIALQSPNPACTAASVARVGRRRPVGATSARSTPVSTSPTTEPRANVTLSNDEPFHVMVAWRDAAAVREVRRCRRPSRVRGRPSGSARRPSRWSPWRVRRWRCGRLGLRDRRSLRLRVVQERPRAPTAPAALSPAAVAICGQPAW